MNTRQCGTCRLCCKTLAVPALEKPASQWCPHACDTGCRIYADRPAACAAFACSWLQGTRPLDERPDIVKAVFTSETEPDGTPLMVIYESYPGVAGSKKVIRAIEQALSNDMNVVVRNGQVSQKFFPDGSIYTADIDPADPLRVRVKDEEE